MSLILFSLPNLLEQTVAFKLSFSVQISFTIKELREQFKVTGWDTSVDIDAAELAVLKENVAKMERKRKRLLQVYFLISLIIAVL